MEEADWLTEDDSSSDNSVTSSEQRTRFRYKPLPRNFIRLLRVLPGSTADLVSCSLVQRTWETAIALKFTALSYCWGEPEPTKEIILNGHAFTVKPNLWEALKAIRQHYDTETAYWIDAICIDQSNVPERNEQVHDMWRIYAQADSVMAWLGPTVEESHIVHGMVVSLAGCEKYNTADPYSYTCYECRNKHKLAPLDWEIHDWTPQSENDAAAHMLAHMAYFSRAWVATEFLQARKLRIIWGQYMFTEQQLLHFTSTQMNANPYERLCKHRAEKFKSFRNLVLNVEFTECVESYASSTCTDLHDRIYAMLNNPIIRKLCSTIELQPDYASDPKELLVVALEWAGGLGLRWQMGRRRHQDNWVRPPLLNPAWLLRLWTEALGIPKAASDPPASPYFRHWLLCQVAWDTSKLPHTLVMPSGRIVDCTGPVLLPLICYESTNDLGEDSEGRRFLLKVLMRSTGGELLPVDRPPEDTADER